MVYSKITSPTTLSFQRNFNLKQSRTIPLSRNTQQKKLLGIKLLIFNVIIYGARKNQRILSTNKVKKLLTILCDKKSKNGSQKNFRFLLEKNLQIADLTGQTNDYSQYTYRARNPIKHKIKDKQRETD